MKKMTNAELAKMDPEIRKRIDRVLRPRDTMIAYKFHDADIETWRKRAKAAKMNVAEWMQGRLNELADNPVPDTRTKDEKRVDAASRPRNTSFSRRFNNADVERWNKAAEKAEESMTSWIERALNAKEKK